MLCVAAGVPPLMELTCRHTVSGSSVLKLHCPARPPPKQVVFVTSVMHRAGQLGASPAAFLAAPAAPYAATKLAQVLLAFEMAPPGRARRAGELASTACRGRCQRCGAAHRGASTVPLCCLMGLPSFPTRVQSCAVEPGGIASNIWTGSVFAQPPLRHVPPHAAGACCLGSLPLATSTSPHAFP